MICRALHAVVNAPPQNGECFQCISSLRANQTKLDIPTIEGCQVIIPRTVQTHPEASMAAAMPRNFKLLDELEDAERSQEGNADISLGTLPVPASSLRGVVAHTQEVSVSNCPLCRPHFYGRSNDAQLASINRPSGSKLRSCRVCMQTGRPHTSFCRAAPRTFGCGF